MNLPGHIQYGIEIEPKGKTRPLYRQVHGGKIIEVSNANLLGLYESPPEADGAYTFYSDLKLSVYSADCIPLLYFTEDPRGPISVVHCGWRGAAESIATLMIAQLKSNLSELHVVLGPSIGSCCFEVREDLIRDFTKKGQDIQNFLEHRHSKTYFALSNFIVATQLNSIPQENIHRENERCTVCSHPHLPSYRRDKKTDPRIQSWIRKTST